MLRTADKRSFERAAPADAGPVAAMAPTLLLHHAWPLDSLADGIRELARRAGLDPSSDLAAAVPEAVAADTEEAARWIGWLGNGLGIEIEPVETSFTALEQTLASAAPAVLRVSDGNATRYLLLLSARPGRVRLLCPDLRVRSCALAMLRDAVAAPLEAPIEREVSRLLETARVPDGRRADVGRMMLRERLGGTPMGGLWLLRLGPAAGFMRHLRSLGGVKLGLGVLAIFALVYALEILGWGVIGDAVLNGNIDFGWMAGWSLLVLTLVPLRIAGSWLNARLAVLGGTLLKSRLLAGSLRLDLDAARSQGSGQLLARVMESQAFEALAINGGLTAAVAALELLFSIWLLAIGAGGWLHVVLLALWICVTVAVVVRYLRRLDRWTGIRLGMTHDLVERMVGHRTVLAQEPRERRDRHDDQQVGDYLAASARLDRAALPVSVLIPAGWMLLGIAGMVPSFLAGTAAPTSLAIGIGGVLFAGRALASISSGMAAAARAAIAWREIGPLYRAAGARAAPIPFRPMAERVLITPDGRRTLIDGEHLMFTYPGQTEPVLKGATLVVEHGERVLVEGPSGGGKSTLASLLVGLRQPGSGLLLIDGLDRHTLGDAWHELATEAPQFHENHILSGTLAFNLLMGRAWPASDEELDEARAVCDELGLGDLIARMPSGLMQMVGETGWQLSHGEKSRIFLARALLQKAELTVLDESFAALDPETLGRCMECAFRRAKTLIVIAHP